ncbi:hypothetical protein Tco_0812258 [Tanacetum coccineum]
MEVYLSLYLYRLHRSEEVAADTSSGGVVGGRGGDGCTHTLAGFWGAITPVMPLIPLHEQCTWPCDELGTCCNSGRSSSKLPPFTRLMVDSYSYTCFMELLFELVVVRGFLLFLNLDGQQEVLIYLSISSVAKINWQLHFLVLDALNLFVIMSGKTTNIFQDLLTLRKQPSTINSSS